MTVKKTTTDPETDPVPTEDEPDAPMGLGDVYAAVLSLTDLVQSLLDTRNTAEPSQVVVHG